jgi:NADP-dependent 3-hydroxy acid dehydrogenase YdfG
MTVEHSPRSLVTELEATTAGPRDRWRVLLAVVVPPATRRKRRVGTVSAHAAGVLDPFTCRAPAIANFSANLAQLLGETGIRVNSVAPGPIWTPLIPATMPEEKVANFGDDTPLSRAGQPAELAPVYV